MVFHRNKPTLISLLAQWRCWKQAMNWGRSQDEEGEEDEEGGGGGGGGEGYSINTKQRETPKA